MRPDRIPCLCVTGISQPQCPVGHEYLLSIINGPLGFVPQQIAEWHEPATLDGGQERCFPLEVRRDVGPLVSRALGRGEPEIIARREQAGWPALGRETRLAPGGGA